jgi:hypothetical protein
MTAPLLTLLMQSLEGKAADIEDQPVHALAYAAWIQSDEIRHARKLKELATEAIEFKGPFQTSNAAVLGYASQLDSSYASAFQTHLDWLKEREYFRNGRPLSFECDGLALLGTALGITTLPDQGRVDGEQWLAVILMTARQRGVVAGWDGALLNTAWLLIHPQQGTGGDAIPEDLGVALASKRLWDVDAKAGKIAWQYIASMKGMADGVTRAATQLTALKHLLQISSTIQFGAVTMADVVALLNGVGRSMRRWPWDEKPLTVNSLPARWDIENEYHVQDMLWAILAPVFPDLDDEEWTKSLGQHHPRADLAIPSLELIIEVKFMRAGGKRVFAKTIEEVAADASTYLQECSGYRHIVAFIWDDAARTEEHAELRQGLMRIRGVHDAVVLSRPAKMARKATSSKAKRGQSRGTGTDC